MSFSVLFYASEFRVCNHLYACVLLRGYGHIVQAQKYELSANIQPIYRQTVALSQSLRTEHYAADDHAVKGAIQGSGDEGSSGELRDEPIQVQDEPPSKPSKGINAMFGKPKVTNPVNDPSQITAVDKTVLVEQATTDKGNLLQDLFLEALSFASMEDRKEEVSEAHARTFEWIFSDEDTNSRKRVDFKPGSNFLQWLKGNEGECVYWINGKAGSGKSTLMRFIYDHKKTVEGLRSWAKISRLTMAGFFFWTSGSLEQRSQVGLLRSLLFQLLQQHKELIPLAFPEIWIKYWDMSTLDRIKNPLSWSLPQLMKGLELFLANLSRDIKICLFVDGLDEFDGDHTSIISFFKNIARSPHHRAKVCLSSRPWSVFEEAFQSVPNLKLQDLTHEDMTQYVHDSLTKDSRAWLAFQKETAHSLELVNEIVERADGVFLWIKLVVRNLLDRMGAHETRIELQQALRTYPTDLDDLFRHILFRLLPRDYLEDASRVFQLIRAREVVCEVTGHPAGSSLSIWELTLTEEESLETAVKISIHRPSDEEVLDRCLNMRVRVNTHCAGLIEIHDKRSSEPQLGNRFVGEDTHIHGLARSKVTYLHRTVRDFLVHSGEWDRLVQSTATDGYDPHLHYLKSSILQPKLPLKEPERHRRLDEWWPSIILAMTHARFIGQGTGDVQSSLLNELNGTMNWFWLSRKSTVTDNWARSAFGTYEERKQTAFHDPFLSLSAKFGLTQYIETQLRTENIVHKGGRPLLAYATDMLIDRRKTVYPLSDPNLVLAILKHGADPNLAYQTFSGKDETPWLSVLKYTREANRRGFISYYDTDPDGTSRWVEIIRLFIEYGANPNEMIVQDRWDPSTTALEVVEMVIEKYGSKMVADLRDMLVGYGARSREVEQTL